jgi:hypothetical protein
MMVLLRRRGTGRGSSIARLILVSSSVLTWRWAWRGSAVTTIESMEHRYDQYNVIRWYNVSVRWGDDAHP